MSKKYTKVTIHATIQEYEQDLLVYRLQEIGFDSFEETTSGVIAYCLTEIYDETQLASTLPNNTRYRVEHLDEDAWLRFY
ncbi:MAG: hypothetical protein Q4B43_09415 [Bacteroidota bacterium]|nr:hypothetical protein HW49_05105 [Porphyromonadaceae bacterium COT-184 OH4590]MDO4729200.1 hypothetical protein [Bacteroidota bacterium]